MGEASFAYDDVALAFVEDLVEVLCVMFVMCGLLSDLRKFECLFVCVKELMIKMLMLVCVEFDCVVFVDELKIVVATIRYYLLLLFYVVLDVI